MTAVQMPMPTPVTTPTLDEQLDARGWAVIPGLLSPAQCDALTAICDREDEATFRKRVVMQLHGYGQGEYRYFAYPLPQPVQALRTQMYAQLAPVANRWNELRGWS